MVLFHIFTHVIPRVSRLPQTCCMNPLQSRVSALVALLLLFGFFLWQPSALAAHAESLQAVSEAPIAMQVRLPVVSPVSLVRGFRAPLTAYGSGHRGIDLLVADGDSVIAPVDGVLTFTGLVASRYVSTVTTPAGLRFSVEPVCTDELVGTRVFAGSLLGQVCGLGYTSHCAPDLCLHFSARNPLGYLSPLYLLHQTGPSHLVA